MISKVGRIESRLSSLVLQSVLLVATAEVAVLCVVEGGWREAFVGRVTGTEISSALESLSTCGDASATLA